MKYDCIIIGGGIIGAAVLDRLAAFDVSCLLLEKSSDVATGASRANSGIVHAGYDCDPGTDKAKFNVLGNRMMWRLVDELDVQHLKCGSLVVAEKHQLNEIIKLKEKGESNGVETEIWDRNKIIGFEPNVSDNIEYALYAPEAGVVSPYQLTIALADRAILNGAAILTEKEVDAIKKVDKSFIVRCGDEVFESTTVINCAGAHGADINNLVGAESFITEFRRGDYFVIDNTERKNINTVIFPLPTAAGKGILVAPTADGNIIYGPTSITGDADDTASTAESLEEIKRNVALTYKGADYRKCIRVYSGNRTLIGHDFIIKKSDITEGFIMAIGICSPGLTSAPAIAEYVAELVGEYIALKPKKNLIKDLPRKRRFSELAPEEANALIEKNPSFGRLVCRCEKVTEAEIVEAIKSPLPAVTVDAVKRRTRAGMGRCQGGFCSIKVMQILSRELGLPLAEIRKGEQGSNIAVARVGEVVQTCYSGLDKTKNSSVKACEKNNIDKDRLGGSTEEVFSASVTKIYRDGGAR